MRKLIDTLASGSWLTRERVAIAGGATAILTLATLGFLLATSHGGIDVAGRPVGTDFSSFYAAGRAALAGQAQLAYDGAAHYALQQQTFGADTPYYAWFYPPFFFLLAAPLALLPYLAALLVWQAGSLALYALALREITRTIAPALLEDRLWWLAALAFPAVFVNLGHGQNGFLSAALLGGALALLDRRPAVAGILFGLLAYKPQLGLLIPFVLIATGRWVTFAAAAATVAALVAAATALFGLDIWPAFLAASRFARQALLENGEPGWEKVQTIFAWVRMWGGPAALANVVQAIVTLATIGGLAWLWRRPVPFALQASALTIASVVAAPFSIDYDMALLAIAIAFLAAEGRVAGFPTWEKTVLAALWLAPLVARPIAGATAIPVGALAMLAALAFIFREAAQHQDN